MFELEIFKLLRKFIQGEPLIDSKKERDTVLDPAFHNYIIALWIKALTRTAILLTISFFLFSSVTTNLNRDLLFSAVLAVLVYAGMELFLIQFKSFRAREAALFREALNKMRTNEPRLVGVNDPELLRWIKEQKR
jgi:hypothetical protein